jgi:predicted amidophosphoribosyltransferase
VLRDDVAMRLIQSLIQLVLPSRCLGCGAPGRELCLTCMVTCLDGEPPAGGVAYDEGAAAKLVRVGKNGRCRRVAGVMADIALARIASGAIPLGHIDLVSWVPHDPQRGHSRGSHLPKLFAHELARSIGLPAIDTLQRSTGDPQRGADRQFRTANVRGAFQPLRSVAHLGQHTRILLIDDVRTTGATAFACELALNNVGLSATSLAFSVVASTYGQRVAIG